MPANISIGIIIIIIIIIIIGGGSSSSSSSSSSGLFEIPQCIALLRVLFLFCMLTVMLIIFLLRDSEC
jgi:hypothetical protein